jgi:hypothetical protein
LSRQTIELLLGYPDLEFKTDAVVAKVVTYDTVKKSNVSMTGSLFYNDHELMRASASVSFKDTSPL